MRGQHDVTLCCFMEFGCRVGLGKSDRALILPACVSSGAVPPIRLPVLRLCAVLACSWHTSRGMTTPCPIAQGTVLMVPAVLIA